MTDVESGKRCSTEYCLVWYLSWEHQIYNFILPLNQSREGLLKMGDFRARLHVD